MMSIDMKAVSIAAPLKSIHYSFPRAEKLNEAFSWCATDYYIKASLGSDFEARGLLVTGSSRVGKTEEIKRLISKFNDAEVKMPDGRPARIVRCLLSGKVTWKDLGIKTLEAFGYSLEGRRTQTYIWDIVVQQAARQGVIGIAFEECQHVFTKDNERNNRIFLDSFKTLLKDSRRPLLLILSGVSELGEYVQKEEQLARLLRPVRFGTIHLPEDMGEMSRLAYVYADEAGLCFDALSTSDFLEQLEFACVGRWGLVIELIVDAFVRCRISGATSVSVGHFVEAFAQATGLPVGFSPFTAPDYRDSFEPDKLLALISRSD